MTAHRPGGPIRWRMHLPVSPQTAYIALTTHEGRASFWAESAPEIDGSIHFRFVNGVEHTAPILDRVPHQLFALRYFGSRAEFLLEPAPLESTDLTLTHWDVAEEEWHEVHAGWLNVLFPLKAYLAFDVDLRNHDPTRTWDHGYADQ